MNIHDAIEQLKSHPPRSEDQARAFLSSLPEKVQEQLISAIYIGRDHIHSENFNPGADISRNANDHIDKNDYARIIYEKADNLALYLDSMKKCAANENFDLANL